MAAVEGDSRCGRELTNSHSLFLDHYLAFGDGEARFFCLNTTMLVLVRILFLSFLSLFLGLYLCILCEESRGLPYVLRLFLQSTDYRSGSDLCEVE